MNNFRLSAEDFDLLYWHATMKMRQGAFRGATQYFNYLFKERPSFHIGLALAYCMYRDGFPENAWEVLQKITPMNTQEVRFHERLLRRVSR